MCVYIYLHVQTRFKCAVTEYSTRSECRVAEPLHREMLCAASEKGKPSWALLLLHPAEHFLTVTGEGNNAALPRAGGSLRERHLSGTEPANSPCDLLCWESEVWSLI